jgi:hypothetical protein
MSLSELKGPFITVDQSTENLYVATCPYCGQEFEAESMGEAAHAEGVHRSEVHIAEGEIDRTEVDTINLLEQWRRDDEDLPRDCEPVWAAPVRIQSKIYPDKNLGEVKEILQEMVNKGFLEQKSTPYGPRYRLKTGSASGDMEAEGGS